MITKFKIFESNWKDVNGPFEEPDIDEQTIAIRSTENLSFIVNIYFDNNGKVIHISGKPLRMASLPDWKDKKIDLNDVQNFVDSFNKSWKKEILYCDYLYKIIASQKYNL